LELDDGEGLRRRRRFYTGGCGSSGLELDDGEGLRRRRTVYTGDCGSSGLELDDGEGLRRRTSRFLVLVHSHLEFSSSSVPRKTLSVTPSVLKVIYESYQRTCKIKDNLQSLSNI
jgi:hypothetical protein